MILIDSGIGAVAWFAGLQSLMSHATVKYSRIKLHRELSQLLEEDLRQRVFLFVDKSFKKEKKC